MDFTKPINVGENQFTVVMDNPNPHGGCLFSPHGPHQGCEGPYIVFTGAVMAPVDEISRAEGLSPVAVVCAKGLEIALAVAAQREKLGQLAGPSDTRTIQEQIADQPEVTVPWEDVPDEEKQIALAAAPGQHWRTAQGVTLVPGTHPGEAVAKAGLNAWGALEAALKQEDEPVQLVPSTRPGEYEEAEDAAEEEDILREVAQESETD